MVKNKGWIFLAVFSISCGASNCSNIKIQPDAMASPLESGDFTALVQGCGNQLISGYTYCRMNEGDSTDETLTFVAPPVVCSTTKNSTAPCATLDVFYPNGQPNYSVNFPVGKDNVSETSVDVPWKTLTGHASFQKGDIGFWPFEITYKWIDNAGAPQTSVVQGEIRLRVILKSVTENGTTREYINLSQMQADSNFVWKWSENGTEVQMTSNGRTYVGQVALTPKNTLLRSVVIK